MQTRQRSIFCCVNGCTSRKHKTPSLLKFYPFPPENSSMMYITDPFGVEVPIDNRRLWEMVLLLQRQATSKDRVCSLHFQASDCEGSDHSDMDLTLHSSAFPTLNLPQQATTLKICMVEGCSNSSKACDKEFFTADFRNMHKSAMWKKRLGLTSWESKIIVCSDHFRQGYPSDFPNHVDFAPSLLLGRSRRKRRAHFDDPLRLTEPEFVNVSSNPNNDVSAIFEDVIKIEPHDLEQVKQEDMDDEHSYSK